MTSEEDPIRIETRAFRLMVAGPYAKPAREQGLMDAAGFDETMASARQVPGGRSSNRLLDSAVWGEPIRLRPARHGGLLGGWLADRFLTSTRIQREFDRWLALRRRGVDLPTPVLAISRRQGLFWRSAIASVEREAALDGAQWLATRPDAARVERAARAFARTLRRLHDAGALHGDLHLRNILIEEKGDTIECLLIDLDRTRLAASVSADDRAKELMRVARSLHKTGEAARLTPRLEAVVLSGYCGEDRELRRAMRRAAAKEARRLWRHRLGWRLGRVASRTLLTALVASGLGCGADDPGGAVRPTTQTPRFSLMVAGDTGRHRHFAELLEGQLSVAREMTREAERSPVDGLLLLGDNFYPHGLERRTAVERIRDQLVRPYCHFLRLDGPRSGEVSDACPIAEAQRVPVPIFAVLGNHDIELPGSAELERHLIPEFLPDWHMSNGLAEVFEVAPGISLILFESEISIRDEHAMKQALHEAIAESRGPWRIVAAHRPIATDDLGFPPRGGYPDWIREAIAESGRPVQLFLAGHHHNLQVFELGPPTPLLEIGLGSGSRAEPPLAQDHPDARFGALDLGFGRVDLLGEGSDARLSVSIFDAAPWPWLGWLWGTHLRAQFEVDAKGHVQRMSSS